MQIIYKGKEYTTEINEHGHHTCDGYLVSLDGETVVDPRFTIPAPTYTSEQILAMPVVELDAVEVSDAEEA